VLVHDRAAQGLNQPRGLACYLSRMPRRLISSGSPFERDIGYSRAVVVGDRVFVSGTTGFDYVTMTISDDIAEQAAQCLRNIETALAQAGASMRDVVRVRYILPNAADFPATWPVLRAAFGEIRPAATMFEAKLADPRMKIEIEVDAIIGSA
jgi:enamine deaminase RidA (YjgF/YER057c/UK114 family)